MFRRLMEEVAITTESAVNDFALLTEEEMDEMSDTFDNFVTPEANPVEETEEEDIDDSIIASVGGELAANAIEDAGGLSDDDSIIDDTEIVSDEDGIDLAAAISATASEADGGDDDSLDLGDDDSDDIEDDVSIISDSDGEITDTEVEADVEVDDKDDDDDDSIIPDDDSIVISDDELGDIDPDDLLGGAFDDDDKIILDGDVSDMGDLSDDLDDLIESAIMEGIDGKSTPKAQKQIPLGDGDEDMSSIDPDRIDDMKRKKKNEDYETDSILDDLIESALL